MDENIFIKVGYGTVNHVTSFGIPFTSERETQIEPGPLQIAGHLFEPGQIVEIYVKSVQH